MMLCRCAAILSVTQGVSQVHQHAFVCSCLQLSLQRLGCLPVLVTTVWPPCGPADLTAAARGALRPEMASVWPALLAQHHQLHGSLRTCQVMLPDAMHHL